MFVHAVATAAGTCTDPGTTWPDVLVLGMVFAFLWLVSR